MKNLITITLMVLFLSCGPEAPMFERQYIIQNNSSHSIFLEFYRDNQPSRFHETMLSISQRLEGSILSRSGGPWEELDNQQLIDNPAASMEADSIVLIFNNEKKAIYTIEFMQSGVPTFDPTVRNLLRDTDYSPIGNDKFLFQITDIDFDNAENCESDCN